MALYLGKNKVKPVLANISCAMQLYSSNSITNNFKLRDSDAYILKDSKGLYLTVKEGE